MNTSSLWEEKKQEPQNQLEPTPESAQNYTIITTETRSVKTEWIVIGDQKKRIRRCPICQKIMIYNSKRGYFSCKKKGSVCRICHANRRMENGYKMPYRGGCKMPEDSKIEIGNSTKKRHAEIGHPMLGRKQTEKCIRLAKERCSGSGNPMFGKHHTEKTCKQISETRKLKRIPGPKMTEDGLRRLRQKRIDEISRDKFNGNQVMPSYNKKSCIFFDKLEKELGWNGSYATKNGEHQIKELGYFVDYYEPNKNIVIEWDERNHYNVDGTLKNEDFVRQNQIENLIKCKFFRIDQRKFDEIKVLNELKQYG